MKRKKKINTIQYFQYCWDEKKYFTHSVKKDSFMVISFGKFLRGFLSMSGTCHCQKTVNYVRLITRSVGKIEMPLNYCARVWLVWTSIIIYNWHNKRVYCPPPLQFIYIKSESYLFSLVEDYFPKFLCMEKLILIKIKFLYFTIFTIGKKVVQINNKMK